MKPLTTELKDTNALRELGRASVQIIHDLKNQINGLKLYATFLRKRLERAERPADELETIAKMIDGLERAAADMTLLVRFGRPVELRTAPACDLARIMTKVDKETRLAAGSYKGVFDVAALIEALQNITMGARARRGNAGAAAELVIQLRRDASPANKHPMAVIEWCGIKGGADTDLFTSFAGGEGLRMALAARIIEAHGGEVEQQADTIRVRLPLSEDDG